MSLFCFPLALSQFLGAGHGLPTGLCMLLVRILQEACCWWENFHYMMAMSKVNLLSFLISKLQGWKIIKCQVEEEEVFCKLDTRYTACHLFFFFVALLSDVCCAIESFIHTNTCTSIVRKYKLSLNMYRPTCSSHKSPYSGRYYCNSYLYVNEPCLRGPRYSVLCYILWSEIGTDGSCCASSVVSGVGS